MTNSVFIYALCEPGTRIIRYIGKARNPKRRLAGHCLIKQATHLGNWVRLLLSNNSKPDLLILREVSGIDWQSWEKSYIRNARMLGFNLVNSTEGGDGISLPGEKNPCFGKFGCEHPAFGREVPSEERENIRQRFLGIPKSPEHRKKLSLSITGKKLPPRSKAWRDNLSKANMGHEVSLDTRLKIGAANRGKRRSLEYSAKRSAMMLGKKRGPYKKRIPANVM